MRKAFVAALAIAALAVGCARVGEERLSPVAETRPTKPNTWRVMADSPIRPGYGHKGVWTGTEVLIWGGAAFDMETGESDMERGGAAYDPLSDSWREIPPAPIPGGYGYSLTWTGSEMLVWGDPNNGRSASGNQGAAYDPATNEWRRIPDGPLAGRSNHLAVWTGEELVVWGGNLTAYEREHYDGLGAAFDPATDTWRRLPRAPLPAGYYAMGAWTGEEVVVLVSPMGIQEDDYPKFAEVAAYNPSSDSWRELESPPFVTNVDPPVVKIDDDLFLLSLGGEVNGGEVNGYDKSYDTGGILDTSSWEWRAHSDPPRQPNQTWEQVALEEEVVIDGLAYNPDDDAWRVLPRFPLKPREFPVVVWTGNELIVWGGAELPVSHGNTITHVDPPPPLNDGAAYTPPE